MQYFDLTTTAIAAMALTAIGYGIVVTGFFVDKVGLVQAGMVVFQIGFTLMAILLNVIAGTL